MSREDASLPNGAMFNAYPDSIGTRLSDTVSMLGRPEFKDVFSLFYILPTFFNSDLDRGFSIIDYDINKELVSPGDVEALKRSGTALKFDLVLNHLSVGSPQFRDMLEKGDASPNKDFFIDWNEFWKGEGEMGPEGHVLPKKEHLDKLFMRKPGLPILKVRFPDGSERPYWNTFYQEVKTTGGRRTYLGQMDLNARSEKVWAFYDETLAKLASYGTRLVRLDAFAYLHKEPGRTNFFNKPGTWEYLERMRGLARKHGLVLLPEIHAEYGQGLHEEVAHEGYPIYDFFFPGLVIDAIERAAKKPLLGWIDEVRKKGIRTVNMLGCHDGIPVLDLKGKTVGGKRRKGLLPDAGIDAVVDLILKRGGRVKNLYGPDGKKISYYQVNATFFSALDEDERKLRLARAIQMFTPGIPQVWYLDLFAGRNDHKAADSGGAASHKEINRTTLSMEDVERGLKKDIVKDQLDLIRFRNTSPAFSGEFQSVPMGADHLLQLVWQNGDQKAELHANLKDRGFRIIYTDQDGQEQMMTY